MKADFERRFLQRAIQLAADNVSTAQGGPFGAVVVHAGQIIAEGVNIVTSTHDPTAHAEIVAIREACRKLGSHQLEGCAIYASCEPCPMCLSAVYWARAACVYFAATKDDAAQAGFDDSLIYREIPLPPAQRRIPCTAVKDPGALTPFDLWTASVTKTVY